MENSRKKSAKERLIDYLLFIDEKKANFYRKTGLANGFLDKNNNINSDKIEVIISIYADLNLMWLITGRGKMLKASAGSLAAEAPAGYGADDNELKPSDMNPTDYERIISALERAIAAKDGEIEALKRENDLLRKMAGGYPREMDAAV